MREVHTDEIAEKIEMMFIEANIELPEDVYGLLKTQAEREVSPVGREVLGALIENADFAKREGIPICQDTGLAAVFIEIGQDVHIVGGSLTEAINEGVRRGYTKGFLRKSCCDPLTRKNTGDNTPAIIHTKIVTGDRVKLTVFPKGGGSENYGEVRMLLPSQGWAGIKAFVLEMVKKGGPNPCPPIFVGVGIGGNLETSATMAKEALLLPAGKRNGDPVIAAYELELLEEINRTGIGPQGYGGYVTCLDVHIKTMPCHIASLPVAVNIQCHAHRKRDMVL
ncbi:MAG: fumarate hydratase [Syntrophorhabdaceae bacterium]|nr:fumarate hydratase [Syntrophorhabdaceae bacterium]